MRRPGDLLKSIPDLVGSHCGIVRHLAELPKEPSEPYLPIVIRTTVANHRFAAADEQDSLSCSGKGLSREAATLSAVGEAVERYSGAGRSVESLPEASFAKLGDSALDPRRLCVYLPEQYEHLPYARFNADSIMTWVPARALGDGREVLVPALAVFMEYAARRDEEFLFPITSNGLATGPTLADAILRATLEVVERDAFMVTWLNRLPCEALDPSTHPDEQIRSLVATSARRGIELRLLKVPTDVPCSVYAGLAIQRRGEGPAAVFGLAAGLDPATTAARALLEVCQVRPALRVRARTDEGRERLAIIERDPHAVSSLEDHDLLYASPRMLPKIAFLLDASPAPLMLPPAPRVETVVALRSLTNAVCDGGSDILYVNLTPPDMESLGLYTVRAILPSFQPIDFGWRERRLAGERIYSLPRRLGLGSPTPASLNDDPHPIA